MVEATRPAQQNTGGPERPGSPAHHGLLHAPARQFRNGVEADAENKRPNPSEYLGVPVRLDPGGRNCARVSPANGEKVPDTEKSSRQQHEEKTCDRIGHHQPLRALFTGPGQDGRPGRRPDLVESNERWHYSATSAPLSARDRRGKRCRGRTVMPALVALDEIRPAAGPPILTRAREESAQRLMMAYAITGLFFMLLPGTFLGVWNLLSISGGHASAISTAWIQAHGHGIGGAGVRGVAENPPAPRLAA